MKTSLLFLLLTGLLVAGSAVAPAMPQKGSKHISKQKPLPNKTIEAKASLSNPKPVPVQSRPPLNPTPPPPPLPPTNP